MKIYLDPGHGGSDPGAQANGLQEKNVTLELVKRMKEMLVKEYENFSVRTSRSDDQTMSLAGRTNDANRWGADFYLSIHINAGGGEGFEDFIHNKLSDSSQTAKLRNTIHAEIIKVNNLKDRGKKKANFHVLRETKMPALLTENGFIDNAKDAAKMKTSSWLEEVARGHVVGLAKALGLKSKATNSANNVMYLKIITDSLWTYNTAKWTDRAVVVKKGEVFTIVKDRFKVDGGFMYKIKSGLYITANPKYVKAYTNKK